MKTFLRIASSASIAIACLHITVLAQSDPERDFYNALYELKSTQLQNVAGRLPPLYQEEDVTRQLESKDAADVQRLDAQVENDNSRLLSTRNSLASATNTLAADNATLNGLRAQLSSAQPQVSSIQAECDGINSAIQSDQDSLDWLWWLYNESETEDPEDGFTPYDILMEMDVYYEDQGMQYSQLSLAQVDLQQAQAQYDSICSQISPVEAQVEADQAQVDAAQNAYDNAVATYNVDFGYLQNAQTALAEDQNHLNNELMPQIENLEEIFTAQYAWVNSNPTYEAWVANGKPE
jgi:predicted  nucleic acid-binding Zn-ribbon protein